MLNDSVRKNAEIEIDQKTKSYMQRNHVDYRTAYLKVREANPDLARKYAWGADAVVEKKYSGDTLSPATQQMNSLVADAGKTQVLAGAVLDQLARRQLRNVGPGVAMPADEYRRALANVKEENPSLARAAQSGYIASDDFQLLALLVPSLGKEVERGNYNRSDSARCVCGENLVLCRGRKLAAQRKIHEDNITEYARCIRDAQLHGDELDKIICLY